MCLCVCVWATPASSTRFKTKGYYRLFKNNLTCRWTWTEPLFCYSRAFIDIFTRRFRFCSSSPGVVFRLWRFFSIHLFGPGRNLRCPDGITLILWLNACHLRFLLSFSFLFLFFLSWVDFISLFVLCILMQKRRISPPVLPSNPIDDDRFTFCSVCCCCRLPI